MIRTQKFLDTFLQKTISNAMSTFFSSPHTPTPQIPENNKSWDPWRNKYNAYLNETQTLTPEILDPSLRGEHCWSVLYSCFCQLVKMMPYTRRSTDYSARQIKIEKLKAAINTWNKQFWEMSVLLLELYVLQVLWCKKNYSQMAIKILLFTYKWKFESY